MSYHLLPGAWGAWIGTSTVYDKPECLSVIIAISVTEWTSPLSLELPLATVDNGISEYFKAILQKVNQLLISRHEELISRHKALSW
ncbi:hypothetical protein [Chitinophaga agri]|uniref:Uncharacterized protein n=1 Tax=Chitinophaga agri TaxID=2703787 RepID=A0A6B9ZLI1_9BACT|nr:hypothetical protein [Chitinophaga agri]QHS61975.1 hypothetical protein GWR21_20915 [Chitinophaga agri]